MKTPKNHTHPPHHFLDSQKNLGWKKRSLVQSTADTRTNVRASRALPEQVMKMSRDRGSPFFYHTHSRADPHPGKKCNWKSPYCNLCLLSLVLSLFMFLKSLVLCTLFQISFRYFRYLNTAVRSPS